MICEAQFSLQMSLTLLLNRITAGNRSDGERFGTKPNAKRTELRETQHSVVFGLVALAAEWGATACRGSDTLLLLNEASALEARRLSVLLQDQEELGVGVTVAIG